LGINNPNSLVADRDLFGMSLDYEANGNIKNQTYANAQTKKTNNIWGFETRPVYSYDFTYDKLSRVLTGLLKKTSDQSQVYALSGMSYDDNGNIKTLNRNYEASKAIDKLVYSYGTANRLESLSDQAGLPNTDTKGFFDTANTTYDYDLSGNLIKDTAKGIGNVVYNHLNLVSTVSINNKTISYLYTANGQKLQATFGDGTKYEYLGGIVYKNSSLEFIPTAEGRGLPKTNGGIKYEYSLKDHLGNLRISCFCQADTALSVSQENHYDVWGGTLATLGKTGNDRYQFLGREEQAETGWVDLMKRMYDSPTARFTTVDPSPDVEGQESLSTYQYGWNNPMLRPDPNGDCPCGIGGFLNGITEALVRNVRAVTVDLPKTAQGMANMLTPFGGVQTMVGIGMQFNKTKSDWNKGDFQTRSNIVGNIVGEVGIAAIGTKGVGSLGKAGLVSDVAKVGEAGELVTVYRGVNSTSPAFKAAESGIVKPRGGILGHSDALTHNTGVNGTANSKMTSWTTNPEVAKNFALRTSGDGIVLSQQVPASSLITSPNLKTINLIQGGGRVSESEVLLKGTQKNLNVQRIGL
jgi:RHS repeat-associated protein